jgi:hypothetical protein
LCTVTVTQNVAVNASADRPIDLAALDAAIRRRRGPRCSRCGYGRSGADRGILDKSRCFTCDFRRLEAIARRLIARVGRKEALRRFSQLAPK